MLFGLHRITSSLTAWYGLLTHDGPTFTSDRPGRGVTSSNVRFTSNSVRGLAVAGDLRGQRKNPVRCFREEVIRLQECRFHRQIPHAETKPYPRNAAVARGFERRSLPYRDRTAWLGRVLTRGFVYVKLIWLLNQEAA